MKIVVGVTDNRWAAFLRDHDDIVEANFWQPSPHGFKALPEGGPFLFKTKDPAKYRDSDIPGYSLVGGGFFEEYLQLRVSEAWSIWGIGNGVPSEADLLERVQNYRSSASQDFDSDPFIGCVILRNLFFARRGDELPQPTHWSRHTVASRGYDATDAKFALDAEEVTEAFQILLSRPRVDFTWEPDLRDLSLVWDGPRHGKPLLVAPRMGQGRFKYAVAEAYDRRCAITGSRTFPSLEAAHIRPYAEGGAHSVSNGLLLRTDVHRLYDHGYLSIAPDLRLRVSPQLREHGWNGVEFYNRERDGFKVTSPVDAKAQPDREALAWHLASRFRAS